MSEPTTPTVPPQVEPAPVTPPVTNGESGKTYTQEYLDRKLQGSGKRIKELEEALQARQDAEEAAKKKLLEDQGKYKELHSSTQADLAAATAELEALRGEKTARLQALEAENKKRIKALPEVLKTLVPEGMTPEQTDKQLTVVEKMATEKVVNVHGGQPRAPADPADIAEANKKKGSDFITGGGK